MSFFIFLSVGYIVSQIDVSSSLRRMSEWAVFYVPTNTV